jgi:hypothetical protein
VVILIRFCLSVGIFILVGCQSNDIDPISYSPVSEIPEEVWTNQTISAFDQNYQPIDPPVQIVLVNRRSSLQFGFIENGVVYTSQVVIKVEDMSEFIDYLLRASDRTETPIYFGHLSKMQYEGLRREGAANLWPRSRYVAVYLPANSDQSRYYWDYFSDITVGVDLPLVR